MADSKVTVNVNMAVEGIGSLDRAKNVLNILRERKSQEEKGYTAEHDDTHGGARHLAKEAFLRLRPLVELGSSDPADTRRTFEIVAALALAGLESIDREEERRR